MSKCYSVYGESFTDSLVDVLEEMASNGELKEGAFYYEADRIEVDSSEFFDVESLLENLQCRADDECGEAAEDFTDISGEQKDALNTLVKTWIKENMPVDFCGVENIKEVTVTQDMLDEYCDH